MGLGFLMQSFPTETPESTITVTSCNNGLIGLELQVGDQKLSVELNKEQYTCLIENLQFAEVVKRKLVDRGHYASYGEKDE